MNSYNPNVDITILGAAFSNDTKIIWQVVNIGDETRENSYLRGGFETLDFFVYDRHEMTVFSGIHWVKAFAVKNNICIAKS